MSSLQVAAGDRIIEPMIALADCSTQHRIIVAGSKSMELILQLHYRGYMRAAATGNCGRPAGQYDVAFVDWRRRTFGTLEATLDWLASFLSTARGLGRRSEAGSESPPSRAVGKARLRYRAGYAARMRLCAFGAEIANPPTSKGGVARCQCYGRQSAAAPSLKGNAKWPRRRYDAPLSVSGCHSRARNDNRASRH
jgi:hypothetical protein